MDLLKRENIKTIYLFNDYIYEFDIIYGNNYIAINSEDEAIVCGKNQSGGLGLGHKDIVTKPLLNPHLSNKCLEIFFNGHYCMFAKNDKDEIFCWGDNDKGQLGLSCQFCIDVKPVKNEFLSNKFIIEIHCSREESVCLDKNGLVYFWRHVDKENVNSVNDNTIKPVIFPGEHRINMLDCGLNHFIALAADNTFFGWGRNNYGQLGNNSTRFIHEPCVIDHERIEIVQICCGGLSSYYLSSDKCVYFCGKCLTEEENRMNFFTKIDFVGIIELISLKPYYYVLAQSEENVFELGKFEFQFTRTSYLDYDNYLSDKFQITNGTLNYMKYSNEEKEWNKTALDALKMFPVNLKCKIRFCHVFDDTSGKNIIYVNNEDEVFVTGSNENCILGDGTDETLTKQYKIDELSHIGIAQFFNGFACMFAKTDKDHIYCWGKNISGLLGLGFVNTAEEYLKMGIIISPSREYHKHFPHLKPVLNPYLSGKGVINFYCYENANFAITLTGQLYGWGWNTFWNILEDGGAYLSTPCIFKFEQENHIVKFSAGLNHFMALDTQGYLFGWGSNHWMQLSNERNIPYNKIEHIFSNVKDVICLDNNSYILTNDNNLIILGQNLRYLKLSRFSLNFDSEIKMLKLNPSKELIVCSETTIFEQIHRGQYKNTFYANFGNYLMSKFSSNFNEYCHLARNIQFENMTNFNYKLVSGPNCQISDNSETILSAHLEQSPKMYFKSTTKFNTYDILELIGVGSYGYVYKIKDHLSDRIFALKSIKRYDTIDDKKDLFNEIDILSKIQSDFIVQYYTSSVTGSYLNIKMEFCECCGLNTLRDLINTKNNIFKCDNEILINIDLYISIEIIKEIAEGLNFLHGLTPSIIHGDLKPNNVFLKRNHDRFIKLGDFGLSRIDKTKFHLKTDILNKKYLAPEILNGGEYSVNSDIYCLGLICEELIKNDKSLQDGFLLQLKDPEPNNRLNSDAILNFLQDYDSKFNKTGYIKSIGWETIKTNLPSKFFIEFLQSKMKFPENNNFLDALASNNPDNILSSKFNQVLEIGSGHFSKVFKVKDSLDELEYAVKRINKKVISFDDENDLKREIEILSKLRDEKLIQYRNCWIDNDHAYIQMEICQFNLTNVLANKRIYFNRIDEFGYIELINLFELSIICEIFENITRSLKCLHDLNIIHRDLKPENILIKLSREVIFKISDFGLSKFYYNEKSSTKNIGDIKYAAPEVDNGGNYNFKADIYSLGRILLDLLDIPFENDAPEDLTFGDSTTAVYDNEIVKLIEDMTIEKEFNLRPDCFDILDRLILFDLNWNRIRKVTFETSNELNINCIRELDLNDILIKLLCKVNSSNQLSVNLSGAKSKLNGTNKIKPTDMKYTNGSYSKDYDEIELIRTGGFGFIFKAKHKHDKQIYAIKKYYLGSMAINNRETRLVELKRFAKLDNINIAQYKVSWIEKNIIYNQMEFCELFFGEIIIRKLEIFQRNNKQAMSVIEYFVFYELFREWVEALNFLHSQKPPLTSGKLNKPLISLNHPHQFIRLIDIQTRKSTEILNASHWSDLKDIGQILRNAPYIFDFDFTTKQSNSIKLSNTLKSKHDHIRDLIFYEGNKMSLIDESSFFEKICEEVSTKMNKRGDEQAFIDLNCFGKYSDISLQESEFDTKTILHALDQLMVSEQQLRVSRDFPIIISHLNVNEEIVFKIFDGKFRYRFNSQL